MWPQRAPDGPKKQHRDRQALMSGGGPRIRRLHASALLLSLAGVTVTATAVPPDAQHGANDGVEGVNGKAPPARPSGAPLFEGPRDRAARLRADRETAIAQTLTWLPGVMEARVHLSPAVRGAVDAPPSPGRAVAVLRVSPGADHAALKAKAGQVVSSSAAGMPHQVEIVLAASARPARAHPAPPAERVGPFEIRRDQAPLLRATLAVLLIVSALLAAGLLWVWRRPR